MKFTVLKSKQVFLIDALGALVSVIALGVVLVQLEEYIGMPPRTLYGLAGLAALFFLYSSSCYLFVNTIKKWHIGTIAIGNLVYCILTAYLVVAQYDQLTKLGMLYFIGEMVVILVLIAIEFKAASAIAGK